MALLMGRGIRGSHHSRGADRTKRQGIQREAERPSVEPSLPSLRSRCAEKSVGGGGIGISRTSFPQLETIPLARLLFFFFFQAARRLRLGPGNRIGLSVRSTQPRGKGEGEALLGSHPLRWFASLRLMWEWQRSGSE